MSEHGIQSLRENPSVRSCLQTLLGHENPTSEELDTFLAHLLEYNAQKEKAANAEKSMLVLTRRIKEAIVIGDSGKVSVSVLSIRGNQVKLGINAMKNINIYREEIYPYKGAE